MSTGLSVPYSPVSMLGSLTLLIAFLVNGYALAAGVYGQRFGRYRLVDSSIKASYAFTALLTLASALLVYAFLGHDYTIRYVQHYSDTSMPFFYKITAYWGGLDGSLLFWVWLLSVFNAVALYVNRWRHRDMIGYVVATVAAIAAFFMALLIYSKNPFATFLTSVPADGRGLNPLLQNYWMVIHPPALYLGYVGMTIPFAFGIAALVSGRLDDAWLHSVRVWVLIAWFALTLGLVLGMIWAYEELGWGGYWAWDPVENAGLLPWLTATAFLHSVMIQERRGMLKVWNIVLMIVTFFLTIFGTFMTRSGIVQSVHAFGQDNQLALLFILFMLALLAISIGLVAWRLPALRSAAQIESMFSREFTFLLNNWILLVATFVVLFGTMFPTISEAITGDRITVSARFFNRVMVPIGLVLMFLTGAGPLLAWRVTSNRKLLDQFLVPTAAMVVTVGAVALLLPRWRVPSAFLVEGFRLPSSLITFGLSAFVLAAMTQELWRGVLARRRQTGTDPFTSLVGVVLAKRRRYGGYLIHVGVAMMFLGFAGDSLSHERQVTVTARGETFDVGEFRFRYDDLTAVDTPHYHEVAGHLTVFRGDDVVATLHPARRDYRKGEQASNEVAIDRRLDKDIYVALNNFDGQTRTAAFMVRLNPLVNWVWIGFALMGIGTAICLLPESVASFMRPGSRRGD